MKMVIINTVIFIILNTAFTSVTLAKKKQPQPQPQPQPQQCDHNNTRYDPGEIITRDGRRYKCKKNGQWKTI